MCARVPAYSALAVRAYFPGAGDRRAGNTDATPASYGWTIDTVAPDTSITDAPADPSGSTSASFSFTSTEVGSTFACQLDGGGFSACTSPKAYSGLADGPHTFEVRATDIAGNPDPSPASHTWTIDTAGPDTTITAAPANPSGSADASFEFSSTEVGSTFECQLDAEGYGACTSPQDYTGLVDGSTLSRVGHRWVGATPIRRRPAKLDDRHGRAGNRFHERSGNTL